MNSPASPPAWRPQFHYTPAAMWMNDPNGLVHEDGLYHLHYQYHPHGDQWGPMHWGHATSTDLLHWQEQPVALAPDGLGMIFSGCIVIDRDCTSGLGPPGSRPWVAVFTHHGPTEAQSLAISLDQGRSWHKHAGNPVLPNPGVQDYRDPKVFWHAPSGLWVMSLAVGDHIEFHGSGDLQRWTPLSHFGPGPGAAGGVWECPDLFELPLPGGGSRWVLLVSLNPGGPHGGSGTQYFVGHFDGRHFVPEHHERRWLDHGPDHYAGVTWHPQGERTLLLGWMSNWLYARDLPTAPWRGAMALPRELALQRVLGHVRLVQRPPRESAALGRGQRLDLKLPALRAFTLGLSNAAGDILKLGFDAEMSDWFVDRRHAGCSDFHPGFAARHVAPRVDVRPDSELTLLIDRCSVELFADGGLSTITSLVFPRSPYDRLSLEAEPGFEVEGLPPAWPA